MSDIAALNSVFVRYLVKVLWIRELGGRIILILFAPPPSCLPLRRFSLSSIARLIGTSCRREVPCF